MNKKIINACPYLFRPAFNHAWSSMEALNPSLLQDYCVNLLSFARMDAQQDQSTHAMRLVMLVNKLIRTMPDSTTNVSNVAVLFNAIFQDTQGLFIAGENINTCVSLDRLKNFLCSAGNFADSYSGKDTNAKMANFMESADYQADRIDRYYISNLWRLNHIIIRYFRHTKMLVKHDGRWDLSSKMCKRIPNMAKYLVLTPFNYSILEYTYSLLADHLQNLMSGVVILTCLTKRYYLKPLTIGKDKISIPYETYLCIIFGLIDASMHGWSGTDFYYPSGAFLKLVQNLNDSAHFL